MGHISAIPEAKNPKMSTTIPKFHRHGHYLLSHKRRIRVILFRSQDYALRACDVISWIFLVSSSSMVKLSLFLKATLDGITQLAPDVDIPKSSSSSDADRGVEYYFAFRVQCSSCREIHPKDIHVSAHERSAMSGSRGDAHFVWKCKNCGREGSAVLDPLDNGPRGKYLLEDSGSTKALVSFETRGCEFVAFKADGHWRCQGTQTGKRKVTTFEGVDLSEGEWYEYDDSAGAEVSITEVEWSIGRA